MAKKVKVNSIEHKEIKDVIYNSKNKTNKEKFLEMYTSNPDLDKKKIAEILGVSLQMIYKYMKE
jgi:predicted transcriptional regulator